MNQTIKQQLSHRSIRKWKTKPVQPEVIRVLSEVANQTATSTAMQSFSIIRVTDPIKRAALADITTQRYVNEAPEFWVFLLDVYRNARILQEKGLDLESKGDMDRFFQGFTDATLAAQNVMNALESLGLGGVFFGSILNDAAKTIEILELPELTFPVLAIGFGEPDQSPTLKPRMDLDFKVFENSYCKQDHYLSSLSSYDEIMQQYYDLRDTSKPVARFTDQVVERLTNPNPKRSEFLELIRKQGFTFKESK